MGRKKKTEVSKRQTQILDYIRSYTSEHHYPPSVREIGSAVGLSSPSTVHTHLKFLEEKGYIKRSKETSRSIVLTEQAQSGKPDDKNKRQSATIDDRSLVTLPLVGRIAAGTPVLAEENIEEEVPLPVSLFGDQGSFLLAVKGESMVEAGILDGDVLLVKEQSCAQDGDIVVALLGDEATVKTYYKEKDSIRLQPQNEAMEPIFVRDVTILGVVTGLFRNL